jgi:outer membrane protein assembly factor BamA
MDAGKSSAIGKALASVIQSALCLACMTVGVSAIATSTALGQAGIADNQQELLQNSTDPAYGFRRGSVIVAPIPFKNPLLGAGLAVGGAYMFQDESESKSSSIGLGGFRTDNGSVGYGAFANVYFGANEWILKVFAGQADVNYDLYSSIGIVPVRQDGAFVQTTLAYGVTPNLSFGVIARYLETTVTPELNFLSRLPREFRLDAAATFLSAGGVMDWDRRDDGLYPTSGSRLAFTGYKGTEIERENRNYTKAYATLDGYYPIWASGVVASRLATCATSGAAPFFDSCSVGNTDALRGFPATQYLGSRSLSAQVEYRQRIGKRFGVVAFAGASLIGDDFANILDEETHSAAGLGLRYRLSRGFPVDFSIDSSINDDGEQLVYIYVGQRF